MAIAAEATAVAWPRGGSLCCARSTGLPGHVLGCVPALRLMCHLRISNNVMSAVFGPKENMHFGQRSLQPGKLRLSCSLGNPGLEPGVVVTRRSVKDHVFSEWEPS